MKKVEDLDVFKLSHSLALEIFEITKSFPEEEKFGLISQMRRAAYSVPMNLMEGAHRLSSREYRQFVGIASVVNLTLLYINFLGRHSRPVSSTGQA